MAWYKTTYNITNPTNVEQKHYSVELILDSTFDWNNCDATLSSLRFWDSAKKQLDYWIEFLEYGVKAVIWIRLPVLPVTGTSIFATYSKIATSPFQAKSYTAKLIRNTPLTLETFPKASDGTSNLACVHPCVVKAAGWLKHSTPNSNDIDYVMVNTPYPYATLPTNWTKESCEVPSLWVRQSNDSAWRWPTGYATWPQNGSGATELARALGRVHTTLHPVGQTSNYLVGPLLTTGPWSDPTMIWIPDLNGGTLRTYWNNNAGMYLYYLDLHSSNGAWTDGNGNSTLVWSNISTCQVSGLGNWSAATVCDSGDNIVLSPSVIYDSISSKYYIFLASYKDVPLHKVHLRYESSDGITWSNRQVTDVDRLINSSTYEPWHTGVCQVGSRLFMMGGYSVAPADAAPATYLWESDDMGLHWKLQFPNALPSYDDTTGYSIPYRPWPIYDPEQGLIVFHGFREPSKGYPGGTMMLIDSSWNGLPRSVPNVSAVHYLLGVDFSDPVFQDVVDSKLYWPYVMGPDRSTTTAVISGNRLVVSNDINAGYGITFKLITKAPIQYRWRIAHTDTTYRVYPTNVPCAGTYAGTGNKLVVKMVDGSHNPLGTITSDDLQTVAGTIDYRLIGGQAWFNLFRHNGKDYSGGSVSVTTPNTVYMFSGFSSDTQGKPHYLSFMFARYCAEQTSDSASVTLSTDPGFVRLRRPDFWPENIPYNRRSFITG